jgi:hypothetical protein
VGIIGVISVYDSRIKKRRVQAMPIDIQQPLAILQALLQQKRFFTILSGAAEGTAR